jgi:hypothetical protein
MKIKHRKSGKYLRIVSSKKIDLTEEGKATQFPNQYDFQFKKYVRVLDRSGLPISVNAYEFED